MEIIINLHIKRLPEGSYLATAEEPQGLIAQGRTLSETLEIAKDVARKLLEEQATEKDFSGPIGDSYELPLVVGLS